MPGTADDRERRGSRVVTVDGVERGDRSRLDLFGSTTTLAFMAFLIVDAVAGQPAAGLTFLGVVLAGVLLPSAFVTAANRINRTRLREIERHEDDA